MRKGKFPAKAVFILLASLGMLATAGVVAELMLPFEDDVPYEALKTTSVVTDTPNIVFEIEHNTDSEPETDSARDTDSEALETETDTDSETDSEGRDSLYVDISSIVANNDNSEYLNDDMIQYYKENPYPEEIVADIPSADESIDDNTESTLDDTALESSAESSDDYSSVDSENVDAESSEAQFEEESEGDSSSEITNSEPAGERILLDVPFYSQRNVMPTGCELVSAKMVLAYYGHNVSNQDIMNNLERSDLKYDSHGRLYGGNPFEVFIGNPEHYSGFGCYPPVIENMISSMAFSDISVINTSSQSLDTLAETYLPQGRPIMVWATIGLVDSYWGDSWYLEDENGNVTDEIYTWRSQEHCMVLVGYDEDYYYFNDPLAGGGPVKYEKSLVEKRYNEMGCYSLVITQW